MKNKVLIKAKGINIKLEGECDIKDLCEQAHDLYIRTLNYNNIPHNGPVEIEIPSFFKKDFKAIEAREEPHKEKELSRNFREESDMAKKNIVDLNNYKIEQASTEDVLVRCPECGQDFVTVYIDPSSCNDDVLLVRHGKEFLVVDTVLDKDLAKVEKPEGSSFKDYYHDLICADTIKDTNVNLNGKCLLYCPICKNSHSFSDWLNAYIKPEEYFEYDNICDVCGGEMVEKITGENKSELVCDVCGSKKIY